MRGLVPRHDVTPDSAQTFSRRLPGGACDVRDHAARGGDAMPSQCGANRADSVAAAPPRSSADDDSVRDIQSCNGRDLGSPRHVLKVDLHAHTADDPLDRIPHTTDQLIARVADLGYQALAVTLHDRQLDIRPHMAHARERGVTLIPGIERTVEGRHVLLLNFREGAADVRSFEDLARLKRRSSGLVIAPHPFFPGPTCLRRRLDEHGDLFDAVEWNAMFTASLNFNIAAREWAESRGKPVVGNGDIHRLRQLGTTYSLIDAEPDADAICGAVLAGHVRVRTTPLSFPMAGGIIADLVAAALLRRPFDSRAQASGDALAKATPSG